MKNINISKPASGDVEGLIALAVPRTGSFGSSGLKASPPVVRSTAAAVGVGPAVDPPSQGTEKSQGQTGVSSDGERIQIIMQ